jgi:hypothetical protein
MSGDPRWADYECNTCGGTPCVNRTFCNHCRKVDRRLAEKRRNEPRDMVPDNVPIAAGAG